VALISLPAGTQLDVVVWDITDGHAPALIRQNHASASPKELPILHGPTGSTFSQEALSAQPYRQSNTVTGAATPHHPAPPYYSEASAESTPFQPMRVTHRYAQYAISYATGSISYGSASTTNGSPMQPMPEQATYEYNEDGLPVNTSGGTIRIERVCVHISNMGKAIQDADIERLLQRHHVNDYDSFTVLYEKLTGRCRGSATIMYSTTQKAERAVRMLDGSSFQDRLLKVKIARESRNISAAAYPVVNGSTY
jgi:hypothetical protein